MSNVRIKGFWKTNTSILYTTTTGPKSAPLSAEEFPSDFDYMEFDWNQLYPTFRVDIPADADSLTLYFDASDIFISRLGSEDFDDLSISALAITSKVKPASKQRFLIASKNTTLQQIPAFAKIWVNDIYFDSQGQVLGAYDFSLNTWNKSSSPPPDTSSEEDILPSSFYRPIQVGQQDSNTASFDNCGDYFCSTLSRVPKNHPVSDEIIELDFTYKPLIGTEAMIEKRYTLFAIRIQ